MPRFDNLSNEKRVIEKQAFRENMGLLGLEGDNFLADRIYFVLDHDRDGEVIKKRDKNRTIKATEFQIVNSYFVKKFFFCCSDFEAILGYFSCLTQFYLHLI